MSQTYIHTYIHSRCLIHTYTLGVSYIHTLLGAHICIHSGGVIHAYTLGGSYIYTLQMLHTYIHQASFCHHQGSSRPFCVSKTITDYVFEVVAISSNFTHQHCLIMRSYNWPPCSIQIYIHFQVTVEKCCTLNKPKEGLSCFKNGSTYV